MGDSDATQFMAMADQMSVVVFIAAVLLIIYLVTRCMRFASRNIRISHRDVRDDVMMQGGGNPSVIAMPIGLDRSLFQALPSFLYKPEQMKIGLECAVCLYEFQENEKGRVLPNCNHSFHVDCIDMWLFSHSTCPLCRTLIHPFSPPKCPQLLPTHNLQSISPSGHATKGHSTSCPPHISGVTPLPETATSISM